MQRLIYLLLAGLLTVTYAVSAPDSLVRRVVATTPRLAHEGLHLPANLDAEIDRLLEKWYDGYGKRGTASLRETQPVPNTPDSVYIQMLARIPSAMRLSYSSVVRESIELYLFKRRALLSSMLSLSDLYFPEIEATLDRHKLPLELKYLTIVESALNARAFSRAGAAGLWQLMLPTGRAYGLKINSLVDERLDPIKSTEAASRLLSELYRIYNDWWLVLAAYNCGPGNVNRALKRVGHIERPTFWDIYPHLPRETRQYVPLFIGIYFAMHYHKAYNIERRNLGQPLATELYEVREQVTLEQIAQLGGGDVEQIKIYNPQFRRGIVPGNVEPYNLRLPIPVVMKLEGLSPDSLRSEELSVEVVDQADTPKSSRKDKVAKRGQRYKIRRGDTLASVARRHGVTVNQLCQWNGLSRKSKLKIGQSLVVSKK